MKSVHFKLNCSLMLQGDAEVSLPGRKANASIRYTIYYIWYLMTQKSVLEAEMTYLKGLTFAAHHLRNAVITS